MDISQFQQWISDKYEKRDQQRGTPATFMWFIEEIGELATVLAEGDQEARKEEFADVFAWLCTLANINDVDLEAVCREYIEKDISGYK